jgi:chromosome segregation ATPase
MDEVMDPNGPAFQDMLAAAQSKGEAALSIKPDTSTTESQTEAKAPESSSEGKVDEKVEEALSDDVDALKNTIRGLKAEMTRVRNQRSASEGETSTLRERLANMEGRLEEIKESQPSGKSTQDAVKKLSDEKLIELHTSYEDELMDARAVARVAERDSDREGINAANQRIDNARKMLNLLKGEEGQRVRQSSKQAREADDENTRLGGELESLFTDVFKAAPELADHESDLWKAGQEEYRKLPTLTKKMGPIGELIATAAAIAKNPNLIGKKSSEKAVEKMLDNIENVADKAFNKGGTAPQAGKRVDSYVLNTPKDVEDFEEKVRGIKRG